MTSLAENLSACEWPLGLEILRDDADFDLSDLKARAGKENWTVAFAQAADRLRVICKAAPYLHNLLRRLPDVGTVLSRPVTDTVHACIDRVEDLDADTDQDTVKRILRVQKRRLHLALALGDLAGTLDVQAVTRALSHFADASLQTAVRVLSQQARDKGTLVDGRQGLELEGLFVIAMGKLGAQELNYSSDIDLSILFDTQRLELKPDADPQKFCVRFAQNLSHLLHSQTAEGYVFRTDLRLRPDPGSTPVAVSVPAAMAYYESVGQNWERAALIKARIVAGDREAGERFLQTLQPFVWRRSLDYVAVEDIRAMQKQIRTSRDQNDLTVPGADIKRGQGGIREIELYAQTLQLTFGGRIVALREPETCAALHHLVNEGLAPESDVLRLVHQYHELRRLEHRLQMRHDEQTHTIPTDTAARTAVACLMGSDSLEAFEQDVLAIRQEVNAISAELYPEAEDLSLPEGSLIFTGPQDNSETLKTLEVLGFENPKSVSSTVRGWHHGKISAMRTARARAMFTRLVPHLMRACSQTGVPDQAFVGFSTFFAQLNAGVQVMGLLLNHPELLERFVRVFAVSPVMAKAMAEAPQLLEALIMPTPPEEEGEEALRQEILQPERFEDRLNRARQLIGEARTRLEFNTLVGSLSLREMRGRLSALADVAVTALAEAAWDEVVRQGGDFPAQYAVVAMGSQGSREMTSQSDVDLLVIYEAPSGAHSSKKGWDAEVMFSRFTQRLVAALSAPTEAGVVFPVDMKLRPSGRAGPVAVRLSAFGEYYQNEAWTWEHMALCRARVITGQGPDFCQSVQDHITRIICSPRTLDRTLADIASMRHEMNAAKPAQGWWDVKYAPGGLVDILFWTQALQLTEASDMPALATPYVQDALQLMQRGHGAAGEMVAAYQWALDVRTLYGLARGLKVPEPPFKPALEKALLAGMNQPDIESFERTLRAHQATARRHYDQLFTPHSVENL